MSPEEIQAAADALVLAWWAGFKFAAIPLAVIWAVNLLTGMLNDRS